MVNMQMKFITLTSLIFAGNVAFANIEGQQAGYGTTQQLANALASALRTQSAEQIEDLFGTEALDVMPTGKTFEERSIMSSFVEAFDAEHFVQEIYGKYGVLMIGSDNWAFPMPMTA